MTILAQLNDCHCCNDACSTVQKKSWDLFAIFGLNGLTCSVLLFITSNFGSWYADCRAFCPGPSSYEDRTLAAWSKKKNHETRLLWPLRTNCWSMKHSRKEDLQKKTQGWIIWQDKGAIEAHWDKRACIREYSGTTCWRGSTESRLHSLRAICFLCFTHSGTTSVLVIGLCVLLCGADFVVFVLWLVFVFFLHLMHKVGIHSKTVIIVMMSAAQEQKKYGAWWMSDGKCVLKAKMVLYWNWSVTLRPYWHWSYYSFFMFLFVCTFVGLLNSRPDSHFDFAELIQAASNRKNRAQLLSNQCKV